MKTLISYDEFVSEKIRINGKTIDKIGRTLAGRLDNKMRKDARKKQRNL